MKWLFGAVLSAFLMATPAVYAAPVDINAADATAIDKAMTGVGPRLAQAIVEYRTKNGPFKSVDDLTKVKGVGKATLEKNRGNLTVGKAPAK